MQIYYSSYWMTRINYRKVNCKKTDSQNSIFTKDDEMIYLNDCLIFPSNQTYGCIDVESLDIFIDIEKHLFSMGYKILNITINSNNQNECKAKFLPQCKNIHFETEVKLSKNSNRKMQKKKIEFFQ